MMDFINKGDIVEYRGQLLKVISDPYLFQGQKVVTCVTIEKKKADVRGGIYAVNSLAITGRCKDA